MGGRPQLQESRGFLNNFVGGRCVSVSFPACTFGKSDASLSIHPARALSALRGFLNNFCWGTLRLRQFSRMHIWKVGCKPFDTPGACTFCTQGVAINFPPTF